MLETSVQVVILDEVSSGVVVSATVLPNASNTVVEVASDPTFWEQVVSILMFLF